MSFFKVSAQSTKINLFSYLYTNVLISKQLPPPKNKTVLLVIDKSGSMEGDNIEQCKAVIKKLLSFFKSTMPDANLNLITFDVQSTVTKDLNKMSLKDSEKIIDSIEAGKSTYFSGVLLKIKDFLENKDFIKDLSIIFMTDGDIVIKQEKENDFFFLNKAIESLKQTLDMQTEECDIHTIGLGKEHDPFFLEKLLALRPFNSTYLFIIDEIGIEPAFKGVKDTIYQNNMKGELILFNKEGKKNEIKLDFKEIETQNNDDREWQLFQKIDIEIDTIDEEKSFLRIKCSNGGIIEMFRLKDILVQNKNDLFNLIAIKLTKIKYDFNEILTSLKHVSKNQIFDLNELDKYTILKNENKQDYNQICLNIFKIKDNVAKQKLFAICEDLSPIIGVIEEMLAASYKSNVKNLVLAKAIQLSHKNIKKKRYIKELDSRLKDTVKLFNLQDDKLPQISSKFNLEKDNLLMKYEPIINDFSCFMTCYNFVEAICDQDCLCITFDISRSENVIFAPEKIKINAIYPTIISAQSFLNSLKYSINLNFDSNSDKKEEIVKGVARESINAALPIYLCKEHWEVSKLLMDRVLGWIVTLDPTGYHIKQKITFPFLLLNHIIIECYNKPDSLFSLKYFKLIIDTCIFILKDENIENNKLEKDIVLSWQNYDEDCVGRLPGFISDNNIFLAKCFCALLLGWIKIDKKKIMNNYFYLVEEELRRNQIKEDLKYEEFKKLSLKNLEENERNKIINEYSAKYNELYEKNMKIMRILYLFMMNYSKLEDINFKNIKLIEGKGLLNDLNLNDNIIIYSIYFQNQLHDVNSIRETMFKNKKYVDCRINPMDVFLNYELNIEEKKVKNEKKALINIGHNSKKGRRKFDNLDVLAYVEDFRISNNIIEAEELLDKAREIKPGKVFEYYANIFLNKGDVPLLLEKLTLMKSKFYNFSNKLKKKIVKNTYIKSKLTPIDLEELFGYYKKFNK